MKCFFLHVCRQLAAKRFRQDPKAEVGLLSLMAAGVGLDFSAATAVVFVGTYYLETTDLIAFWVVGGGDLPHCNKLGDAQP